MIWGTCLEHWAGSWDMIRTLLVDVERFLGMFREVFRGLETYTKPTSNQLKHRKGCQSQLLFVEGVVGTHVFSNHERTIVLII